jgi:hypothetical protein
VPSGTLHAPIRARPAKLGIGQRLVLFAVKSFARLIVIAVAQKASLTKG